MKPIKLETTSVDSTRLNLEALYQIAPSCFTEVEDVRDKTLDPSLTSNILRLNSNKRLAVNFETLRQLLGDNAVDKEEEMYQFTWPGKQAARREAAVPITDTLRPVPEDSVDWDTTQNLYIEGDNLRVLKLLQRGYMGKVKMIYIDPPYNTGNDFVYHDDFAHSAAEEDLAAGNLDEEGYRYRKNLGSNGRFHSDWCSMMYSRLLVARSLLTEDGVIFISIDDNEQKNLKNLCDEVFGGGNFLAQVVWERAFSPINLMKHFSPSHDYILCYAKNLDTAHCNGIPRSDEADARYSNPDNDPRGVWSSSDISVGPAIEANIYTITTPSGREVEPPAGRSWRLSRKAFRERLADNRIWFGSDGDSVPRIKRFLSELRKTGVTPMTLWKYTEVGHSQGATQALAEMFDGKKVFDYPKPVDLIKRVISLYTDKDSIVLDFFSGSATTAQSVMELNAKDEGKRKFILVQYEESFDETSDGYKMGYRTICDAAEERIRRAGKKIKEDSPLTTQDLDTGFRVFRLADSNFENVEKQPGEYDQQLLDLFADNIKADRTDLDLLFGAMLSWGVQLSLPMQTEDVDGCKVYSVDGNGLVACFAENITENVVKTMAGKQPLRVLFRDSCFAEDKTKINIFELFKQQLDWDENEAMQNIRVI